MDTIFPWDGRDQEDQAEARYNAPLRAQNQCLEDENLNLKRLLREAGIPWNTTVASHPDFQQASSTNSRTSRRRSSRLSALDHTPHRLPHLPVEVILRVMEYALVAKDPIIDPLSKINHETLTVYEAKRGPQTAIGFLATCRAYNTEGKRFFWTKNVFTFTSPETLRRFGDLQEPIRNTVRHINLRIIARYYDDVQRAHKMDPEYHPSFNSAKTLHVIQRHQEPGGLSRSGFRSYTWTQTVDFLDALRAPFDPARIKSTAAPRPRLLPQLMSMRMDFVNFPDYFLPMADASLHEMAAHELGYTLNELMVTGLPRCEVGHRAGHDLQGMLKDDGLFMVHEPTYFQQKRSVKFLKEYEMPHYTVVRSYRRTQKPKAKVTVPAAPEETGHPESIWKKRKTVWKRVPINRDAELRTWMEFDRYTGENVKDLPEDSDEDVCPNCGVIHGLDSDITDYDSDDDSI